MNKPEKLAALPFDTARLDALLDEAGIDVLLATAKHSVQYLTGNYRSFFFDTIDAIGIGRYLPVYVYTKGKPERALMVAGRLDNYDLENGKIRAPQVLARSNTSIDATQSAAEYIKSLGLPATRIGIEPAFMPVDALAALTAAFPNAKIIDAFLPLERLRAVKTPAEMELLRIASERVVEAMLATFKRIEPGMSKDDVTGILKREETARDINFEYCLITAGASLNRAPSPQKYAKGDILSLDSGGNYRGYVGDLCRMGILGEPDAELIELLGVIEQIQQATRKLARPGTRGGDLIDEGRRLVAASPHRAYLDYTAHGLGVITHEAPRLMDDGPVPYPGYDKDLPLQVGTMLSIETTMQHPKRGFIKLEDTVAVTAAGPVSYGDGGRGWNRAG